MQIWVWFFQIFCKCFFAITFWHIVLGTFWIMQVKRIYLFILKKLFTIFILFSLHYIPISPFGSKHSAERSYKNKREKQSISVYKAN